MTADENSWSVPARRFPRLRHDYRMMLWVNFGIFISLDFPKGIIIILPFVVVIGLWLWLRRPGCLRVQTSGITFPCGLFIPAAVIEEISPSPAGWQIAFQHRGVLRFVEVREACFDDAEWPRVRAAFRAWHRTCA